MMFALELQRRLAAAGSSLKVTASHPGFTQTDLGRTARLLRYIGPFVGMKTHDGALTTLRAATDPAAEPGSYWGPAGLTGTNGPPVRNRPSKSALDEIAASRLFDVSEKLTGVTFDLSGAALPKRAAA